MRYQDIFVPGGLPQHTYNPRVELQLEEKLSEVKDNLCKLVTVTGQTKSGKTVLARKILPPEETIWIDGGSVSEERDFWQIIVDRLELFDTVEEGTSSETITKIGGKGSAEADFIIAKGNAEINSEIEKGRGATIKKGRNISPQIIALRELKKLKIPLIVDDFHYIPRDIQGKIVRSLKPLIFDGFPVVIIAIPHRRYDALKVEKEMTGRISTIQIPSWKRDDLEYIPNKGFELLNYEINDIFKSRISSEAIGSPHLIQEFCRVICKLCNIDHHFFKRRISISEDIFKSTFKEVADNIGRPIFEKLARGPRSRTDRIQRSLKNGKIVDIYELILYALAYIKPDLISIEYEGLRSSIKEVSGEGSQIPQLHEVARVLKHMATIAATDQSSTPVIDFDDEEKKLHITDPFFAFYLRWGDLSKENEIESS